MIQINNLSKRFGKLEALNKVSLSLEANQCIALIGPNGCGKTTLIKSILGMVLPQSGDILFNGTNIRNNDTYRKDIGYMPQIGHYPANMTVGQLIEMIKGIRNEGDSLDMDLYEQYKV